MSTIHQHRDPEKAVVNGVEEKPQTTLQEDVAAYGLEKVYERHGRIDLIPLPSDDPQDPLNWASWRKHLVLIQVAFAAMMGPFSAAATIPSFESFVEDFNVSITQASYSVSIVIIFLGVFPLIWAPVANRIGRRPVLLASFLISSMMHVAGGYTNSYGAMMTTRVFQGIFLSPAQSLGGNMASEMFFLHEKGAKMGIWTLFTSLGPPVAPFIMGFVQYHTGIWRWTFFVLAIINAVQFLLYLFLGPETLFDRVDRSDPATVQVMQEHPTAWWRPYFTFKRWGSAPWSQVPIEIVRPLGMFAKMNVFLPTLSYGLLFSYTNVLMTVEIPALLSRKAGLNAQQTGLNFLGAIIGACLGEIIAGRVSDLYMMWRTRKAGGERDSVWRLPFALPGYLLGAVGVIIFGVQLQNMQEGHWNVTPIVGVAIAVFSLQLVTTTTYAFAVESQPPHLAGRVPPFISFLRQLQAFVAPFYLSLPFEEWGNAKAAGLYAGLAGGIGIITTVLCMVYGRKWRNRDVSA
ncbi:hypothetical protein JCM8097_004768 [Rhodosporidiobolus ruineniae]